jgi:hypothetical protein
MFVCCVSCVLSVRSLCDELITRPTGFLPIVVCRCVWSRNLVDEEVLGYRARNINNVWCRYCFSTMPPHVRLWTSLSSLPVVAEVLPTSEVGTPMRRSYVVGMRWMVICGYEVPGGALNVNSTKLPGPWSPWEPSPSRKNPHGRTGNLTRDLMIIRQELWSLDHEADQSDANIYQWYFVCRNEMKLLFTVLLL